MEIVNSLLMIVLYSAARATGQSQEISKVTSCYALQTNNSTGGSIVFPHDPHDYTNPVNCEWHINAGSTNLMIEITFPQPIFAEEATDCLLDSLMIYSADGAMLRQYCGTNVVPPKETFGRSRLFVKFVAKGRWMGNNFRINYSFKSDTAGAGWSPARGARCDGFRLFNENSGSIRLVMDPGSGSLTCRWPISSNTSLHTSVHISSLKGMGASLSILGRENELLRNYSNSPAVAVLEQSSLTIVFEAILWSSGVDMRLSYSFLPTRDGIEAVGSTTAADTLTPPPPPSGTMTTGTNTTRISTSTAPPLIPTTLIVAFGVSIATGFIVAVLVAFVCIRRQKMKKMAKIERKLSLEMPSDAVCMNSCSQDAPAHDANKYVDIANRRSAHAELELSRSVAATYLLPAGTCQRERENAGAYESELYLRPAAVQREALLCSNRPGSIYERVH